LSSSSSISISTTEKKNYLDTSIISTTSKHIHTSIHTTLQSITQAISNLTSSTTSFMISSTNLFTNSSQIISTTQSSTSILTSTTTLAASIPITEKISFFDKNVLFNLVCAVFFR